MANTPWLGIDHLRFGIIGASVSVVANGCSKLND